MRSFISTLLLLGLSLVSINAQMIPNNLPECVKPCIGPLVTKPACATSSDPVQCICTHHSLILDVACCVGKHCHTQSEIHQAYQVAHDLCNQYNTVLPKEPTCGSSSNSGGNNGGKSGGSNGGSNGGKSGGSSGGNNGASGVGASGFAAAAVGAVVGVAGLVV